MADNLDHDRFRKVSMYQEIWYLISKYNIPVNDHETDIVILIDKLCKEDDDNMVDDTLIDNMVEHEDDLELKTNSFVYHSPMPPHSGAKSEYSSVVKFPRFPLKPITTTTQQPVTSSSLDKNVYISQMGEKYPSGFVTQDRFSPTQKQNNIVTKKLPKNQGFQVGLGE